MRTFDLLYSPEAFDSPDDADNYEMTPGESGYVEALLLPLSVLSGGSVRSLL